ncbi:MAG: DUF433 domain-containing protein [Pseudonocardiaceae bacterium]
MAFERISIDHAKMGGLPCIRDLRIPVSTVLGQLAAGRAEAEILEDFPDLEHADIMAALEYAAAAVQERALPLAVRQ